MGWSPSDTEHLVGVMTVKSVDAQSPPVDVEWKFGEGDVRPDITLDRGSKLGRSNDCGYISSICFSLTIGTMGMAKVQKAPSYHLSTDACPGNNFSLILNYSNSGYLDQITYENWNISSHTFTQNLEA
ncbi:hypothetical protein TNCV_4265701 [Trichonephila clavipes]|nr:hypothetical protein TNCV_4265701 [Trichonephila clavipes]